MLTIHDHLRIEDEFRRLKLGPETLRNLRTSFYKRHLSRDEALSRISGREQRESIAHKVDFHSLDLQRRLDSQLDGASKLLFRGRDGALVETVILRIDTGRTALCVSSQVGCAAGCSFCATSRLHPRDLTSAEILDQLVQAGQILEAEGRRVRNVVFMGMGEPFHNEAHLNAALEVLTLPTCFNHSERKVLISTVGIPAAMVRCARRFPGVNLALSLHSAREETRRRLVPLAKVYDLKALRSALEEINSLQKHPVMIEYLLLKGWNDSRDDARALVDYLRGLRVHINLIPYNPIDGAPELEGTPSAARRDFGAALKRAGRTVTLRASLGKDIDAACGQLATTGGDQFLTSGDGPTSS